MTTTTNTSRLVRIVVCVVAIAAACTDSGPRSSSVTGSWIGSSAFGGTQSPTTRMTLTQNGTAVSGTMRVTGSFPIAGLPLTGQVDAGDRTLTWIVLDGCEAWGGVLNINDDGTAMTGGVLVDRSGCTSGSNSSGTMTLTRE